MSKKFENKMLNEIECTFAINKPMYNKLRYKLSLYVTAQLSCLNKVL